jgi:hypothetical protein
VLFSYYPFLELDIMSHMSAQDVNFIEQQGCFRVPTRPALDEFVREYFLHVHPSLPIIDEGEFWNMYAHRGNLPPDRSRMSLFIFQAILFASCSVCTGSSSPAFKSTSLTFKVVCISRIHSEPWIYQYS